MTNEEYFEYMDKPLSDTEKQTLIDAGWAFSGDDYLYIPDDYDGCMASGVRSIRRVLLHLQHPTIYIKYQGRCKEMLEEIG
jgi:hypothetical protein